MRGACLFSLSLVLAVLIFSGPVAANPLPAAACCLQNGTCQVTGQEECNVLGGYWMDEVWTCSPNPCFGACCTEFGTCIETDYWTCTTPLGAFMGPFTSCLTDPCNIGACCLSNGSCVMLHHEECEAQGGTFTIEMYNCSLEPCQHLGACCHQDRTCSMTVQILCSGEWQGEDEPCLPNPCDPAGVPDRRAGLPLIAAPNPFVGETFIRLVSRADGTVSCRILDPRGRVVRELSLAGGSARWDGRDNAGRLLPAGAYFARVGNSEGSLVLLHLH